MGIDDVFAVIAEGTRRQILKNLRDGDKAVGELVVELQVSQPTVSKHLKVLREAGLVTMRAQGQKRYYSLDPAPLDHVRNWLADFEASATQAGTALGEPAGEASADATPEAATDADVGAAGAAEIAETGVLAAAVLAAPQPPTGVEAVRPPIGRTMGRAAERAADLLSQLRRRRES
ncbi:ArsR/SmtB family transcription factor [Arthrobacter sp. TmT3-37]|uniref:Transcriptional regulator n=1 Tax=Arthrobacter agilis TaxID=37921 RepID=A0A2L0UFH3_9MICC|nr:metalloregulator ArsR/SmtB family transcription factor [Arthrobacter agilis]AUZ87968.1 transcriptional regulator [Arthrobacter agilis]